MPRNVSDPTDVPVSAGVAQRLLRLGYAATEWPGSAECSVTSPYSKYPVGGSSSDRRGKNIHRNQHRKLFV